MNTRLQHFRHVIVIALLVAAVPATLAGWPTKIATEDPGNTNPWGADPDPWQLPDTPVPTTPGTRIWIAVANLHIPENVKTVKLTIWPPTGRDFDANGAAGYYNNGNSQSTLVGGRVEKVTNPDGSITFTATLDPQPDWEVFELVVTGRGDGPLGEESIPHEGDSNCVRANSEPWVLELIDCTHNSPIDTFAITEIMIFPEISPIDIDVPPVFFAPPHTGEWYYEYVFMDPHGEPRPQGGVRWFCAYGPGIQAEDVFELLMPMLEQEQWYWMYMYDLMDEFGWQTYLLGTADEEPECPEDVNGDGFIDLSDLAELLASYGTAEGDPNYNPAADINQDGSIDLADLAALLSVYGTACP